MFNIFFVRFNVNGKSIVMIDWDLKVVVIGDNEGKVIGKFVSFLLYMVVLYCNFIVLYFSKFLFYILELNNFEERMNRYFI